MKFAMTPRTSRMRGMTVATLLLLWTFVVIEISTIGFYRPNYISDSMATSDVEYYVMDYRHDDTDDIVSDIGGKYDTTLSCPDHRRPLANQIVIIQSDWQRYRHSGHDVYIYSAYFDDRPAAGFLPIVRIIILATYHPKMAAFCHLWYKSVRQPIVTKAIINETGMNQYEFTTDFGKRGFREYTYSCPLTFSFPPPTHVSITVDQCGNYSTFTRITSSPRQAPPIDFGVCVANGHGFFKPEAMIEWFELNRMFGVTEFNLYDTMYENMTQVFEHYQQMGVLKLFSLRHPLGTSTGWYQKVRNLRTVALNDCMLRNMYRYRYLVVIDHDEIIVPKSATNYRDMMREIDRNLSLSSPFHAYTFFNTYFLLDFKPDETKSELFKSLRFRKRVAHEKEDYYYAPKSFVSPLSCFNLFNHYCHKRLPGFEKEISKIVPFHIAASHHYRKCGKFYRYNCTYLMSRETPDDTMLRYEVDITKRVRSVMGQLL